MSFTVAGTMRRPFLKLLSGSLVALLANAALHASTQAADRIQVVYHLSEGLDQASRALANIRNHLRAEPDVRIVVVALGDGIRFLLDGTKDRNGQPYAPAVAALALQGVEFRVCNNTLTAHNIPPASVLPQAKIVDSGVAEVARLQAREGFAYLRP